MKTRGNYHIVKVGDISKAKLKKLAKNRGGALSLTANELKGTNDLLLHPANAKKVLSAQKANRGTRLDISEGEIQHDVDELQGGSFFSGLWDFVKNNGTSLLDIAANVAKPFVGEEVANAGRSLARSITGKGLKLAKGSQAAKDHMAALRSKRKLKGSSFRLS
ncbi:hypothetical protein DYB25_001081 [Aphanomyces astaci]|uniref:Uncharacterized protein n=1 Tax=Aphanomyces astaci TaxID=112090 RepID=A0A397AXH6_APHAT|nr:hypothetical protein DYB25_001081 [Aphanomyces astaci]RHY45062.1 hypothetical protein DYB30_003955 [Aphanomyces astaci]RHY53881.1 hypothetical protein DYB34_003884 [Aphanomyces astaci]RHY64694.1 hypothetical protein DYB38_003774 [Aphanomyces astaci]RHZ04932.1 hypothetical protein DYB31_002425 [Aphanomyces astaci]